MFEIENAQGGGYFWRLRARNGQILCHSEVYTSKAAALNGIDAVCSVVPDAQVFDHSR